MSWSADDLLALVASVLAERQAENGTPGVGYGVVAGGEIRSGGSGVSALDGPPVTGSTMFRLCSITKPMTSTLVMSLVEDGLLDLDEPVVRRLPELELAGAAAREALTLRHLLLHTSGLEGEWRGDLATYGDGDDALAALIGDYGRLAQYAPAGAFWGYCNTGYWLAGHLAATAAGTSYEQALRDRVLVPLSMHDTVLSAEEAKPDRLAEPHSVREGQAVPYPPYDFPRARVSSGGVISSADDLLKFAAFHLGVERPGASSPLPAHRIAELREPAVAAGPGEAQSLGWATLTGPGPLCIGHSGSYGGFATRLLLVPEAGIGVVVLTNADPG
ncbi:MAG: serine hydrolase domain-containing protein, partial [Marmoricola sp.]